MEGHCSTGQSPQWAVVPMEEEDMITIQQHHTNVVINETYLNYQNELQFCES